MSSTRQSSLEVRVDGAPLDEAAARALWTSFSRYMDEHRGDTAGFARLHGWFRVSPEHQGGFAVLVVETVEGAPRVSPAAPPPHKAKPRRRR